MERPPFLLSFLSSPRCLWSCSTLLLDPTPRPCNSSRVVAWRHAAAVKGSAAGQARLTPPQRQRRVRHLGLQTQVGGHESPLLVADIAVIWASGHAASSPCAVSSGHHSRSGYFTPVGQHGKRKGGEEDAHAPGEHDPDFAAARP